jgi:membrane-associated phospholipid phosphatase
VGGLRLRADEFVTFGYISILTILVIVHRERIEFWPIYCFIHLTVSLAIVLIVYLADRFHSSFFIFLRNWYQFFCIPCAFRELNYLIHPINPEDIDPILVKIDFSIFGVHPTVWLERFTTPILTEYLQIIYSTFYFLPLVLGGLLWRKRMYGEFQEVVLGVITTFYLSYLGYIAFPALGPRFEIEHLQTIPLKGILIADWLRETLNTLEMIQRDAFPSGHTGVALVILYYSRRFHRRSFPYFLIIIICLIFSTVYLRYHYVIDVIAGFILAGVSFIIARFIKGLISISRPSQSHTTHQ